MQLRPTGDENVYMFGTRKIKLAVLGGRLSVRVGGGFMPIEEFVRKNGPSEKRKMRKQRLASVGVGNEDMSRVLRRESEAADAPVALEDDSDDE